MGADKNKLAKNTVFLYARMIIILVVSLFTTRIVLKNLGIQDYGIYNVVGSIVSLFSFLQSAMTSSNYRFFAYAIGEKDFVKLKQAIKTSIFISLIIIFVTFCLGEILGLYYIYNYLNVPEERFDAALITFQISLISVCVQTAYMPYFSLVISHENMSFFGYLSIIESVLKIVVASLIIVSPTDKLIFYSLLLLACNFVVLLSYIKYCNVNFEEMKQLKDASIPKFLLKDMFTFSGWTFFVTIADIFVMQGLNMMINSFFSPVVNAARGIAVQIQSAVDQFRGNLQTAFNPQITKQYANKEYDSMFHLMYASGKYSAYIMLIISLPLMFSADYILSIWLDEVPEYTSQFLRIILVSCIIDGISNPFVTAIGATGNVKVFQVTVGITKLLILPISLLLLYNDCSPIILFMIYLVGTIIVVLLRIIISSQSIELSLYNVYIKLFCPILKVSIIGMVIDYYVYKLLSVDILSIVLYFIFSTISMVIIIYTLGLSIEEKLFIKSKLFNYVKKNN